MFNQHRNGNQPAICNLVPGYAFYEGMGDRLAGLLVDFIEAIADLASRIRR